ncbi:MAG: PKD domain-containing protein, partial [Bacteroidetes bacterium]
MKKIKLFLVLTIFPVFIQASHIAGGDIAYECLPDGRVVVTLKLFRDCEGISVSSSQTLEILNGCTNTTTTTSLPQVDFHEVSQLCGAQISNSSCNGGTLPGMEEYIFRDTITLPAGCDNFTFSWDQCCRNTAITNFNANSTSNDDIYIQTQMFNHTSICNSSPIFTSQPIPYVCVNTPVTYNYGAFDPEGDSLVFSLVSAMDLNATPVNYGAGYSATSPIPGITIDPQTGELNFTPTITGNFVVVVQVDEYDINGNHLTSEIREIQFVVQSCSNTPPQEQNGGIVNVSGSFSSSTSNTIVMQCPGENVCFDLVFGDGNATNTLTVTSNIDSVLSNAVVTYTGTNPVTANVCYTYQPGDKGGPVVFTVKDDACPIQGINTFTVFFDIPQATVASADVTICGDMSAQLEAANGNTFTWSVISGDPIVVGSNFSCNPCANPVATPSQTTQYLVTSDFSGCINHDTVVVFVVPNFGGIYATAGTDQVICEGQCVTLTGSATKDTIISNSYTYSEPSANLSITNTVTVTSPINVSGFSQSTVGVGTIESVCLDITHTWDSDLDIYLECPDGTRFELSTDNGSSGDNYTNTCFTANATTSIISGSAPFTGNFIPEGGSLSTALQGCPTNGTWNLVVMDDAGADNGTLNSWSLVLNDSYTTVTNANSYVWTPASGMSNSNTLTPTVCPGATTTYTLYSYDENNCYDSATVAITVSSAFTVTLNPVNETCIGASDGSISTSITGSAGPFTYTWSNGANTSSINGLAPGSYSVTVSDGSCSQIATTNILPGVSITASIAPVTGQCLSGNSFSFDGTGSTISSGTITSYTWDFGDGNTGSGATVTHSYGSSGTYTVSLTVSDGTCTDVTTTTVNVYAAPTVTAVPTNVSCGGLSDGSVTANASGGTSGYSYNWDNGLGLGQTHSNIGAGVYTVTVTDLNGCKATATTTVQEPPALSVSTVVNQNVSCNGGNDGSATASVSGGTPAYSYNWSNGSTSASPTNFSAGTHTITVTDASGCTIIATAVITEPPALSLTTNVTPTDCNGAATGEASVSASGGTPGYTYNWTSGSTSSNATNLSAGSYTVTVTDANG